jgi:UPF0176 protein
MVVIAFYSFFEIKNLKNIKNDIHKFFEKIKIKGKILIGPEGLNGTIAVNNIDKSETISFIEKIGVQKSNIKLSNFDGKTFFKKFKINIKDEIVTSDFNLTIDEIKKGQFIKPKNWEEFIAQDDVIIVDTRNDYEFKIGHFKNAINPDIKSFREFKNYIEANKINFKNKKVAIYCTGGIRCEKAGPLMQKNGIDTYQLKGGILKYFEKTPASLWDGECFVFDYRVSVNKNLQKGEIKLCYGCNMPLTDEEFSSPHYKEGFTCPNCYKQLTDKKKRSLSDKREHWKRIS